jgi:hypothetical protein
MSPRETFNKIITTVNSITPDYEFIPDLNNCIVIDTSNNRIGINTITPDENIHVSGGKIKCFNLDVLNDLSTNNVASHLIPRDLSYNLGSVDYAWNDLYLGPGTFYMDKRKIMHIVKDLSLLVIDNSNCSLDVSDVNHLNIRCDVSFNRSIEVISDASINGVLDLCGDLILSNKNGISTIRSTPNLVIEPNNNGDVSIKGNLIVEGTTSITGSTTYTSTSIEKLNVISDASINGILDVCGDLLLTNKSGISTIYTPGILIIDPSIHNDKSGDVIIKGNLDVKGTTTYINSTIVEISDNVIQLNANHSYVSEGGIQIRTFSNADVSFCFNNDNQEWTTHDNDLHIGGNLGVGINNPTVSLDISSTNALKIPGGRTLERPYSNDENIHAGYIRYNIEQHTYEGFGAGNAWGTLGGVKDVDQDTYIIAESSAGVDNDDLQFYTAGVQRLEISNTGDFSLNANNVFINSANSLDLSANAIVSIYPEIKTEKIYATNFDGTFGVFDALHSNATNLIGVVRSYGGMNVYGGMDLQNSNITNVNTMTASTINATTINATGGINASGGMDLQNKDITSVNRITANTFSGGTYSSGSINGSVTIGSRTATDINTAITNNANAISANTVNITNNANAISANATDIYVNTVNITNMQGRQDILFLRTEFFESGTFAPYSYGQYTGTHHSVNNRINGGLEITGRPLYVSQSIASTHTGPGGGFGQQISIFCIGSVMSQDIFTHSDDRLKHNEQDITNGLDIIRQLKPQVYNKTLYRKSADFNGVLTDYYYIEAGLIAQDILNINDLSYCILGGDYTDSSGVFHEETYSLNYNNIFTYNVAATKELDIEVEKLKEENKVLKSTLNSLLLDLGRDPVFL